MADVTSNLDQVELLLDRLADGFNFETPGVQRALGLELADVAVDGMSDRTIQEQAQPDGAPLAALSPRYLRRKVAQGFPALVGVRTGQMLSRVEMLGTPDVSAHAVRIVYGDTEEARLKLLWFHLGCGVDALGRNQNRPPRIVWGLDDRIVQDLSSYAAEQLRAFLAGLAAGGP